MGAVDTMELFFERLNAGDREAAVSLMDERTEMRVHVGDSVQTLRGIDRVGGWFLRGDRGLRMIPGEVRDMGNTYQEPRSEEHTSELQSPCNLVCRLLLEKKKKVKYKR